MLKLLTALGIVIALIFLGFLGLMVYAYLTWPEEEELKKRKKQEGESQIGDLFWMTQKITKEDSETLDRLRSVVEEEEDEKNID